MFLRHKFAIILTLLGLAVGLTLGSPISAQDATPGGAMPTPGAPPTATPIPRPLPTSVITQDKATLELYFSTLDQGQTGLLHVTGEGVAGARARFLDKLIDFFPMPNDGYYGFISVSMEQNPRKYDLDIFVWYDDTTRQTINTQVEVDTGDFIRQDVTLGPDKAYLADPEIERNELAHLESIFDNVSDQRLWDDKGFQLPIPGGE